MVASRVWSFFPYGFLLTSNCFTSTYGFKKLFLPELLKRWFRVDKFIFSVGAAMALNSISVWWFLHPRDQSPAERARLGIKDNLVRFSCGIEDYEDILNDVMQSLDAL